MEFHCMFQNILDCSDTNELLDAPLTTTRKEKVKQCSKKRDDEFYETLDLSINLYYHQNCYLTYTSNNHIERYLKRKNQNQESPCVKRSKRSSSTFFDFKKNCLICGEACNIVKDKKHPERWEKKKSFLCRTADRGKGKLSFKDVLLQQCADRGDATGDLVRIRIEGACSDLHAAEARYHEKCLKLFQNPKEIASAKNDSSPDLSALKYVSRSIKNFPDESWSSLELHEIYSTQGGIEGNRSRFITKLKDHMNEEIYVFSCPGVASIIMLKQKASHLVKIVSETNNDEFEASMNFISKKIKEETFKLPHSKNEYKVIEPENLMEECSDTLMTLLKYISPNFEKSLSAVMIGNIVTAVATKRFTKLQLALSIFANDRKLIEHLHEYGITSTYQEFRRFKISAAASSDNNNNAVRSNDGLIQIIADNFDAHIHSQNGLKETHNMATIITQSTPKFKLLQSSIPRLKQESLKSVQLKETEIKYFKGQKNPPMPESFCKYQILPLKILCHQALSLNKSRCDDLSFIKAYHSSELSPDFNGYNCRQIRESGISLKPKSKVTFLPLIDKTPSDPSTILTVMHEAERITIHSGQEYTVFTLDQQLYKVALDVIWSDALRWNHMIPRLGGMHWLMSFIGCVGVLMENSGLVPWLQSAFASVPKMMSGKKFPMNMRALRFAVMELLKGFIDDVYSFEDLEKRMENLANKSMIAEHWVNNLIKPVLLMMLFVRAEREGEFPLHLYACQKMIPYFFAAGHINYARFGLCYLLTMSRLPPIVLDQFLKGEHVLRHREGLWNGIWSDMMIETSYMKFGKGPNGIIGKTTKPRTLQIWAKSQHTCSEVLKSLDVLRENQEYTVTTHKEEKEGRMKADLTDKVKLHNFLETCIHPLDSVSHPKSALCNIYTGQLSETKVNVNKSVDIGTKQMVSFQKLLPDGFRSTIKKEVITMKESGKSGAKKNTAEVYNTDIIFSRVMYLLSADRIQLEDLFKYELAPVPTALFNNTGEGRYPKSKSVLKNALKVEVFTRKIVPDATFIDGCAMLHSSIHWPKGGKVNDFLVGVRCYISKKLINSDVYLIFDRYNDFSIKSDTRQERLDQYRCLHSLKRSSPLPSKEVTLRVTKTKVQLIELIKEDLIENLPVVANKFIITSKQEIPEQLHLGTKSERCDLITSQEEADVIIPYQVLAAITDGKSSIKVYCEDTDVFVLLCHSFLAKEWEAEVFMEGFQEGKSVISIKESVRKHVDVIPHILSMHALTGCDSVPMMFGIGKKKALCAIRKCPLLLLGDNTAEEEKYIKECKNFVAACYNGKHINSSDNRESIWRRKTGGVKITSTPPSLCSLPPTDEALELNIKRARYQRLVWGSCLKGHPPSLDPCQYGWEKDEETRTLRPIMLPTGIKSAPDEVLKISSCGCTTSRCSTKACSCSKSKIGCTEFCTCNDCENEWNVGNESEDENSSEEE